MKIDSYYPNNYTEIIVNHPFYGKAYWLVAETVKLATSVLFLNLCSQYWVKSGSTILKRQFLVATVLMPVMEEVICRFFILRSVQYLQQKWNQYNGKPVLTAEEEQRQQMFRVHLTAIVSTFLHLFRYSYNEKTVVYQGLMAYVNGVGCGYLNDKYQHFSSGVLLNGLHHFCTNAGLIDFSHISALGIIIGHILLNVTIKYEDIEPYLKKLERLVAAIAFLDVVRQNFIKKSVKIWKQDSFDVIIQAPVWEEFWFRGILAKGIHFAQIVYNDIADVFYQKVWKQKAPEDDLRFQQIFRVHLSAFVFAAFHLQNPHKNIQGACQQFIWTYLLGVSCGHLTEKYQNLAESILFHGVNNFLTMLAMSSPPQLSRCCVIAIFVNQAVAYAWVKTEGKSFQTFCLTAVSYGMQVSVSLFTFLTTVETNPAALVAWSVHRLVMQICLSQDQMIDYVHTKIKHVALLMGR